MRTPKQIRVLLVDDHPVVREGYRRLLDNEPDISVVGEGGNSDDACRLFDELSPHVVILDLNMPGIGGIATLSRLLVKNPAACVLVFSMHDSTTMISRALEAGAAGYLTKSSAAEQMLDAVRAVAAGKPYLNHNSLPSIMLQLKSENPSPLSALSKREFEVFSRIAAGHTVAEIANELSISPKTAGVHQTNIMNKLGLRNAAELTRLAIRSGVVNA